MKDIFEVERESSGATPQLSKEVIMGSAVKVLCLTEQEVWFELLV